MEVQARLSLLGLVSSRFESPSISGARVRQLTELFEENKSGVRTASHIGVFRNGEGGWAFEKLALDLGVENRFADDGVPLARLENDGQHDDPLENKKMQRARSANATSFLTLRSEASQRRSDDYFQAPQVEEDGDRW